MNTELLPVRGLVLCAVSGGADSMYLLCRLGELGYPVAAAHYNHGLRGAEADRDEAFVRAFCAERGIPFLCEKGDVASFARANRLGTEEAARTLRYAFLEKAADRLGAAAIATAHTADDNVETILMHLIRGAGLAGLGGISPRRGRIVRPMLGVTRAEIERYLAENGVPHVEDSTNGGDAFVRNRLRRSAVPALRAENPLLAEAVGRTAELLRQDEEYLSGLAAAFVRENARGASIRASALLALAAPVASRVVRMMAGGSISMEHTRAILDIAARGGMADISGMRVGRAGDRLFFGIKDAPPLPARELVPGGETALPETEHIVSCRKIDRCPRDVHKSFNTFYFKCANICGSMTVASRRPGDRYRPAGRGCTKSLKQLFEERGIPPWERGGVPVLRDGAGVLGGLGLPPAERVCARAGDEGVIEIKFMPTGQDVGGRDDPSGC